MFQLISVSVKKVSVSVNTVVKHGCLTNFVNLGDFAQWLVLSDTTYLAPNELANITKVQALFILKLYSFILISL